MKDGFRHRMGMLHTWAGLVLSALLFAIFWTGSLSVFDKEIDRWMMPHTRIDLAASGRPLSVDQDILPILQERASGSPAWSIVLPGERSPFLTLGYEVEETPIPVRRQFHPGTLEQLPVSQTRGASNFIYPFHHNLTLRDNNLGAWLVGIASMGMLCLLISGVVIHRKIFIDFFTLRLFRSFGRSNLDVHNLTGVVLLPFTIMITLSGLVIAHLIYYPKAPDAVFAEARADATANAQPRALARQGEANRAERRAQPDSVRPAEGRAEGRRNTPRRSFLSQGLGRVSPPKQGIPAGIAPIDPMIAAAERDWGAGSVFMIRVNNPGDAGGVVAVRLGSENSVTKYLDNRRFSAATGEPIKSFQASPTVNVWNFIGGMHYLQFSHWTLRWLYFLGGLGACAMIATGLFHWTQARNKRQRGVATNVALMNVVNIATVTGIIAATAAFLVINRVIDNDRQFAGFASRDFEVYVFFGIWLLSLAHATFRVFQHRQHGHLTAWKEQCLAIAGLALAAVVMNWTSSGDHLLRTLFVETYWPVAGVDLSLLASALIAVWAARKLASRERNAAATIPAASGETTDRTGAEILPPETVKVNHG